MELIDIKSAGWIASAGILIIWFLRGISLGYKLGAMHADIRSIDTRLKRLEDHIYNPS